VELGKEQMGNVGVMDPKSFTHRFNLRDAHLTLFKGGRVMFTRSLRLFLSMLIVGVLASSTNAAVQDLRALASANADLWHHYTFENDGGGREEDKEGTLNLQQVAYGTGAVNQIAYMPGFDATTDALRPQRLADGGAGLWSASNVDWGVEKAALTVEALIAPQELPNAFEGYAVNGAGHPVRGYFIMTNHNETRQLETRMGHDPLGTTPLVSPFTPGDWYYIANTYTVDGSDNQVINSYVANLTAGTGLQQVLTNHVAVDRMGGTTPLGVGILRNASNGAFAGEIDEVALYRAVLTQEQIEAHFNAIPEPNAIVLLCMGGLWLIGTGWRRREA